MHKLFLLASLIFSFFQTSSAQDSLSLALGNIAITRNKPTLQIGNQLPHLGEFKVVKDQHTEIINFSDLKPKLLILDFWHQYCTACLNAMPKLEKLQKKFGNDLFILPVTFQSEKSAKDFFQKRNKIGMPIPFTSIVEDTLLRKYFPHDADPYNVWINQEGKLIGLTRSEDVSEELIKKVLTGDITELQQRGFDVLYDRNLPLLVNNNGGADSSFTYRSIITRYNHGLPNGGGYQIKPIRNGDYARLYYYNASKLSLFMWAYRELLEEKGLDYDPYKKKLIIDDNLLPVTWIFPSTTVVKKDELQFRQSNFYSYELILPASFTNKEIYLKVRDDLSYFFKANLSFVKKQLDCYQLIRINNSVPLRTKGVHLNKKEEVIDPNLHLITLANQPIKDLVRAINLGTPFSKLVVDETGLIGNVDISFKLSENFSLLELQSALKKYGLMLKPAKRTFEMVHLKKVVKR